MSWNHFAFSVSPFIHMQYTGWSKKTAWQSLWHHNFATVRHRVERFSAKCSERNSLHD